MTTANNNRQLATKQQLLPENLPAGAQAFQAAADGKLTKEIWEQILQAQIEKATQGDRGAAKFLIEYAGGVASLRGATFVQENHSHTHYHEAESPGAKPVAAKVGGEEPALSPDEYETRRQMNARRVSARVAAASTSKGAA